jgi:hypothetical protein
MVRLTSPYLLVTHCLDKKNTQQRLFELALYEFSSPFAGQEMMETPFHFYEGFVVACAYTQNAKFVRHM